MHAKIKQITTVLCAVLLCLAAVCGFAVFRGGTNRAANAEASAPTPRVVGYLPTWVQYDYDEIDFTALTHVNIAFINVDANANLSCGIRDTNLNALVKKAHENGVKVMAALGGGGGCDGYRDLISTSEKIKTLNQNIEAFLLKYHLDGVDLDIELGSGDRVWKNYGEWVRTLRAVCDGHGWLLSTATAQWVAYDVTNETFALFDFVNVMAYDNDTKGSSSHSSYEFSVECVDYFHRQKQVPKEKIVLGVPFYGMGYDENGNLAWESYVSFADLVKQNEGNYETDSCNGIAHNGIAYTGATTMRQKCKLGKEYGGIMIWEITQDAVGEYSLLSVIKEELLTPVSDPTDGNGTNDTAKKKEKDTPWILISGIIVLSVFAAALLITLLVKKKKLKK